MQSFGPGSLTPKAPQWLPGTGSTNMGPLANLGGATGPASGTPAGDWVPHRPDAGPVSDPVDARSRQAGRCHHLGRAEVAAPAVGDIYTYVAGPLTSLTLPAGISAMPSGPIQWVGTGWRPLGPTTQGMWAPANPDLQVRWDPQGGKWILDMSLPQGLQGDGLKIEAGIDGGMVGVPDRMTWFDVAGIPDLTAATPPGANPANRWAKVATGTPVTSRTPEPDKVLAPLATAGSSVPAGELLEWRATEIAGDLLAVQGGIPGFSYKVTGNAGAGIGDTSGVLGAVNIGEWVYWTETLIPASPAKTGATLAAATGDGEIREVDQAGIAGLPIGVRVGEYVRWDAASSSWESYVFTPRWVREGITATKPTGYWERAQAGTVGMMLAHAISGNSPTIPAPAAGDPYPAYQAVVAGTTADPGKIPTGVAAGSNVFAAGILPNPANILDEQGKQRPFVIAVTFWNENLLDPNYKPDDYMSLLAYNPPDASGHYSQTGMSVPGTEVGLLPGSGNLYLPDGWVYMGSLKGIPGPAGEIRRADAHTIPPVATGASGQWELGQATIVTRWAPVVP